MNAEVSDKVDNETNIKTLEEVLKQLIKKNTKKWDNAEYHDYKIKRIVKIITTYYNKRN